jgi:hypothetical protein
MSVASCSTIFTLRQIRLFKFEVVVSIIVTIIIITLVRTLKLTSDCQVSTYANKEVNLFFNKSTAFEVYKLLEGMKTFLKCMKNSKERLTFDNINMVHKSII